MFGKFLGFVLVLGLGFLTCYQIYTIISDTKVKNKNKQVEKKDE